jgi:hypothetical protein
MIKLKDLLLEDAVMDFDAADALASKIKKEIDAPYVNAKISTLGGRSRPSVMVSISLDPRDEWENKIFQNSRWMMFAINYDGVINQHARDRAVPNFRKARFKTPDEVIKKINRYLAQTK